MHFGTEPICASQTWNQPLPIDEPPVLQITNLPAARGAGAAPRDFPLQSGAPPCHRCRSHGQSDPSDRPVARATPSGSDQTARWYSSL
jgi:hypothetical protein